ncbi:MULTISPECIES: hypothetical protein [unclassified Pseudomonas]|jgi:hypothetical protein|uniref:hypothetical protein n=1 Tax=unclassified Pseudomonas TaxID=196821 RepID=UPI000BDCD214|nr:MULTISPECIES: hypothetical protein [unclassified Pseudomonas]SNY46334.1 hypothetical protein SAMN05660455_05352 [Pseudomonas sp. LAMO17WK12:I5]SNY47378.1 hypothetical protein SAMN05660659_05327 [Pseudomonas sp. LAMO17WK12:I6]
MENELNSGQPEPAQKLEKKGFPTELLPEPQTKLNLSSLILHLVHLETKDVTLKWVFDHIRNYVICGVVLWAGVKAFKLPNITYFDTITHYLGGGVLLITAITLFSLNMLHGIVGFAKLRDLKSTSTILYIVGTLLAFFAGNILFITAK